MILCPSNTEGSGRIIKTIFLEKELVFNLFFQFRGLTSLLENHEEFLILNKRKKHNKIITSIEIVTKDFGEICLVTKEVFRTAKRLGDIRFLSRDDADEFINMNRNVTKHSIHSYRFVIPRSIPNLKYQKYQGKKRIFDLNFHCESHNAYLLSELFLRKKCQNFLLYFQKDHYLIVQHCDASLNTECKHCNEEEFEGYFLQVLYALWYMQKEYKMMHNDLFVENIVIQRINKNFKWKGQLYKNRDTWRLIIPNGNHVYIKASKSVVKITDLGFSHSEEAVRSDIIEGDLEDIGMPKEYSSSCDIMTVLNDLYCNYKFPVTTRCLNFICKYFQFEDIETMRKCTLIEGQEYRVKPSKLEGLSAELLLNNLNEFMSIIVPEPIETKKILYL